MLVLLHFLDSTAGLGYDTAVKIGIPTLSIYVNEITDITVSLSGFSLRHLILILLKKQTNWA